MIATMDLSGDAPKLIREARCGLILSPGDAEGLAEVILKLYSNRGLCEEMGLNGRCYAEQHLSLHLAAERYENLFTQVLK